MLRPRIIPCLLLSNGGLIKTVKFGDSKYVGDPIKVVKILNEKEVDELILLDINKSTHAKEIDFDLIEKIAGECRMPLCYGGGVSKIDDFVRLIKLGVEKIAINTSLLNNFDLIKRAAEAVGSQSIVAVLDIKKDNGTYQIFKNNGKINTLMITMQQKNLEKNTSNKFLEFDENGNRIIYKSNDILLQKWNNIIINYNGGVLDVFLNGELVKSDIGVVPYYTLDNLTIGENNGLNGGICNVVYFNKPLTSSKIYNLYNSVKFKTPPTTNDSNTTIISYKT